MPALFSDTNNRWKEEKILDITKFIVHLQSQSDRNGHLRYGVMVALQILALSVRGLNPSILTFLQPGVVMRLAFIRLKALKAWFRKKPMAQKTGCGCNSQATEIVPPAAGAEG